MRTLALDLPGQDPMNLHLVKPQRGLQAPAALQRLSKTHRALCDAVAKGVRSSEPVLCDAMMERGFPLWVIRCTLVEIRAWWRCVSVRPREWALIHRCDVASYARAAGFSSKRIAEAASVHEETVSRWLRSRSRGKIDWAGDFDASLSHLWQGELFGTRLSYRQRQPRQSAFWELLSDIANR